VLATSKTSKLGARLREGTATLGEVFVWLSALYFRGKLEYAQHFGMPLIMGQGLGLRAPDHRLDVPALRAMGKVSIESPAFLRALRRDAELVATEDAPVVLLGSIATTMYIAPLLEMFGDRLLFPETFVGRGDMSRGGLLLRATRATEELAYVPVLGAIRHGVRPPKLPRMQPVAEVSRSSAQSNA